MSHKKAGYHEGKYSQYHPQGKHDEDQKNGPDTRRQDFGAEVTDTPTLIASRKYQGPKIMNGTDEN